MKFLLVIFIALNLGRIDSATPKPFEKKSIDWEKVLPLICLVESSNRQWAHSYLGEEYGRGLYGVSELCLEEYKRKNQGNDWITPAGLYNTNVGRTVALWYLRYLEEKYHKDDPLVFEKCLSSYFQGPTTTFKNGVNWKYVNDVLIGAKNFE